MNKEKLDEVMDRVRCYLNNLAEEYSLSTSDVISLVASCYVSILYSVGPACSKELEGFIKLFEKEGGVVIPPDIQKH
jgi:hypothetical protein